MTATGTEFSTPSRRRPHLAAHVGGAALLFVGVGILISAAVEAGAGGDVVPELLASSGIVAAVGFALWRSTRIPTVTTASATFVAVGSTWVIASLGGAVPFLLTDSFPTFDAAIFESVSGFTGTGSTVLSPIEDAPRGVLFWRSMTQFYGGTGMVILAVAILPFLGIGGMELLRAEAPGPTADRLAPRVSETARRLWLVYGTFTLASIATLLVIGLSPFDAVTHAFTIVSTGGLSPYDSSIAEFDSLLIEMTIVALMLFGATNFTLHWRAFSGRPGSYWRSPMFRFFVQVFVTFVTALTLVLWILEDLDLGRAARDAVFNVATLLTSTGFGTVDFVQWTAGAQLLLLALMVSGGMAGSTAGGLKLVRVKILLQHARREVTRIRHPRAVLPIRLGKETVPERIAQRAIGFALLYFVIIGLGTLTLVFLGGGLPEAAGAAASMMGNMGPALGEAGPASNFLYFSRPARAVLMVMMFAGRLEIFPVLYLLTRLAGMFPKARVVRGRARSWVRARRGPRPTATVR